MAGKMDDDELLTTTPRLMKFYRNTCIIYGVCVGVVIGWALHGWFG